MALLWASFLRHVARHSSVGSLRQFQGVEAAWVHSSLIINNGTYLGSPVATAMDLRTRLAAAWEDANAHKLPWALYLYEPYVSALSGEELSGIAAEFGLARLMAVEVMTGDVTTLKAPVRPLPSLEYRRILNRQDGAIALDINLRSYGLPASMGESVIGTDAYFSDPQREFGFLAFAEGAAVSTATVIELDGWLYVALVATDPEHRQKGYAEAVMRHALRASASELKISRTALDASAAGSPVYLRMGYEHTGEAWSMYVASG